VPLSMLMRPTFTLLFNDRCRNDEWRRMTDRGHTSDKDEEHGQTECTREEVTARRSQQPWSVRTKSSDSEAEDAGGATEQ
jgi:hypothetical protein